MNNFSFAKKNIKNNFQNYFLYIVSISFNVGVFYIFYSLLENADLKNFFGFDVSIFFGLITSMVWFFSGVFIQYSTSFFLKRRHKEIGVLNVLGVHKRKIAALIMLENLIIGFFGILFGIFLGTIFQKFVLMILVKLSGSNLIIASSFSFESFFNTTISFLFIIVITSLFSFYKVFKLKIYYAFKPKKIKKQVKLYLSIPLTILGILIIAYGYHFAIFTEMESFIIDMVAALFWVIIGSYLFFKFLPHVLLSIARIPIYSRFNATRIIISGQLAKKLNSNYNTFYNVSIISAVILTILGTTFSFNEILIQSKDLQNTYDFNMYYTDEVNIDPFISKYSNYIKDLNSYEYLLLPTNSNSYKAELYFKFVPYSEASNLFLKKGINLPPLAEDQFILCDFNFFIRDSLSKITEFNISDKAYTILDRLPNPILNSSSDNSTLIVSDSTYNSFRVNALNSQIFTFVSYDFKNIDEEIVINMKADLNSLFKKESFPPYSFKADYSLDIYGSLVLYIFSSVAISLVFLVSMGSILYFRILDDAQDDCNNYKILAKLGLSMSELKLIIANEIGLIFLIPLFIAILHSTFAINSLSKITSFDLTKPILLNITIFICIYFSYYMLSLKSYYAIVFKQLQVEKTFSYRKIK